MSIPTETLITLNDSDKIGLSDTLDNYSIDDIKASGYVGAYDPLRVNNHTAEQISMWQGLEALQCPFACELVGSPWPSSHKLDSGTGSYTGPVFSAIIWLYVDGNGESHTPDIVINQSDISNYKLVTEMPANKMYYTVPSLNNWNSGAGSPVSASSWSDVKTFPSSYYAPGTGALDYHSHYGEADDVTVGVMYTYPYMMYEFDGYFYFQLFTQQWDYYSFWMNNTTNPPDLETIPFASSAMTPYTEDSHISLGTVYNMNLQTGNAALSNLNFSVTNSLTGQVWAGPSDWAQSTYGAYDSGDSRFLMWYAFGGTGYTLAMRYYTTLARKEDSLLFFANSGVKIVADTLYKPIIENGVVTGITDDMTDPSELDDWGMGNTDHGVSPSGPPAPPEPGDDDDNDDPISTAGAPYAHGLVNYYAMTAGSPLIDHISEALSTWDLQNTGKDLFKNLVSCKLIKPPAPIPSTGSEPFTIYGEKPQYHGADINLPVVSGNPDASFGPYTISRKFNDFRDYAPYTRVSIYLPYCGWCDLPSHVVGKSVSVKYFTDIIAATVRAVVFCGNNIIAEAAGVMGLDIPFTADAVGMKQAGVVSGLTAYAGGALQTAAGVAQVVTAKDTKGIGQILSGGSKLISAYTQTAIAFNENTTEISGKNGDGCCLSGATNILIKIIRPKYGASSTAPFVPAGFAHAVGFVSNKEVRVGNVTGLLIADNVDTSGISGATDAERAEIKRVLETGLIVNAAPE